MKNFSSLRAAHIIIAMVIVLAGYPSALAADTQYYRANSIGSKLEKIPAAAAIKGYVLSIEIAGVTEKRILYNDGKEERIWTIERGDDGRVKTTTAEPGKVVSVEYSDASGTLIAEDRFVHGDLSEKVSYIYGGGILKSVLVTEPSGTVLYQDDYEYSSERKLRRLVRRYPDGSVKKTSFGFSGERLREERTNVNGTAEYTRYDTKGNIESKETWGEKTMISREIYKYQGGALSSSVLTMEKEKTVIYKTYSPEGFVIEENRQRDGVHESAVRREYSEGKLIREYTRNRTSTEEKIFTYAPDGRIGSEKIMKNGIPERIVVYTGESTYTEDLYRSGKVFMRVTWVDGRKISEEFISDGAVIRKREGANL